jgi:methionyl-tRNA formyltransferase
MTNRSIALFAADEVGSDVAEFFGQNDQNLVCLVLDAEEAERQRDDIRRRAKLDDETPVYQSHEIENEEIQDELRSLDIDIGILAWWPYVIIKKLIDVADEGFLNFHPSYLPYNRGKDPNFWSIIEGNPFGVSIHWVEPQVDSGPIAFQKRIEKSWEDTGEDLYNAAQEEIVKLFIHNYDRIKSGQIPREPQDDSKATYHERRELEPASEIELDKKYTGRNLLNLLRARTFPPHPGAWFTDDNTRYEVRISVNKVDQETKEEHNEAQ